MRISDWSSDVCSSDLIRDALSAADRKRIDDQVIRPMARFLSDGSPQVINRIHNHATWAAAGVGSSDARRVGEEGVSTGSTGWSPKHYKKNQVTDYRDKLI